MNKTGSTLLLLALCARASAQDAPTGSAAQEVDPETIVIIDRAPDPDAAPGARDRDRMLGDAPFVTIVHADDHPGTTSVADAVGATVGVQSRSLGGLGAYESISVRGAAPGHTVVLVDGIPLARLAAVTTDLGRYSLSSFSEVELYRGAVPVELGGAGVGGALNLVTRLGRGERGERITASLGAGSYGARHLRARYGDRHFGRIESASTLGYQAATGDYTFFSDNGTLLNKNDDTYQVRKNNGFSQLDAATRLGNLDRSSVGGVRLAWKNQGLPGSATQPSLEAGMSTLDVIGDARLDLHAGSATARQLVYGLVEKQRLDDPAGELGLGSQERGYLTLSGGASSTWQLPLGVHRATAGIELRADRFKDSDGTGMRQPFVGDREGGAALAAIDFNLDPTIVVTPALRFDLVRTAPTPMGTGPTAGQPMPIRRDAVPSPRISARAAVTEDVSIKTSAGWYVRLPTLVELFGNRGAILGSPDLLPERGPTADAGVVWAPAKARGDFDRILVEASVFGTRSHDTIAFINSSGFITRAVNLANTQTYGGELVASMRIGRALSVTANYTRLVTQQLSEDVSFANKAVPREPGHAVYARADLAHRLFHRRASIWLDGSWQSSTYLDQANFMMVPARLLAGTGARIELAGGLAASLAVENLADTRVQQLPLDPPPRPDLTATPTALADVAGFPLPGRTVYVSLDWSY
ncbi:MAG TPA: TonB-dependent receptor [Kofleriaceae bacterium]|nr:TonB-dependent receptor [Kofleriaceae bacterium]